MAQRCVQRHLSEHGAAFGTVLRVMDQIPHCAAATLCSLNKVPIVAPSAWMALHAAIPTEHGTFLQHVRSSRTGGTRRARKRVPVVKTVAQAFARGMGVETACRASHAFGWSRRVASGRRISVRAIPLLDARGSNGNIVNLHVLSQ